MAEHLGRLTIQIGEMAGSPVDEFVHLINQRIAPATPLTAELVYIASMYLVSDEVNSFGGRFPIDEHPRIAQLLIDSPVIVGHRKDRLPIGRTFHAELVERDGRKWVKSLFYWLRNTGGAEDLRENIEGGIYKECSIAFTYNLPECSICGQDIRLCAHETFQQYQTSNGPAVCHFNYRQIERVLETSLVYRGAVPDTLVTREDTVDAGPSSISPTLTSLGELSALDPGKLYLVVPRYESIPVIVSAGGDNISVRRADKKPLGQHVMAELGGSSIGAFDSRPGLLIGYHGKERCRVADLERYLIDRSGPVSRLALALYLDTSAGVQPLKQRLSLRGMRFLPYGIADRSHLSAVVARLATRAGVEIWPFDSQPLVDLGYLYNPGNSSGRRDNSCRLEIDSAQARALLTVSTSSGRAVFVIANFDRRLLQRGGRFVADCVPDESHPMGNIEKVGNVSLRAKRSNHSSASSVNQKERLLRRSEDVAPRNDESLSVTTGLLQTDIAVTLSGKVETAVGGDGGVRLTLAGALTGRYVVRPITIGGRHRHLFYCLNQTSPRLEAVNG